MCAVLVASPGTGLTEIRLTGSVATPDALEDTALAEKILANTLQQGCNVAAMLLQPALPRAARAVDTHNAHLATA